MSCLLKHISPRTKVLSFAISLVLFPGAILSYFGFRSVSENADNLASTYRGTVSLVRDKIESEILGQEEALRASLSDLKVNFESSEETKVWIRSLKSMYPAFERFFVVDRRGAVISAMLSRGWVKRNGDPGLQEAGGLAAFREAEESEFVRKDSERAMRQYADVLAQTKTPAGRSLIMSRIGRCYFKLGRYREGIAEYRKVLELPAQEAGSVPAAIAALGQIADGYALLGEKESQEATLFALYQHLLRSPWDLERGDYAYYLRSVITEIDSILKAPSHLPRTERQLRELKQRERNLLNDMEFLQLVYHGLVPQVLAEMSRQVVSPLATIRVPLVLRDSTVEVNFIRLSGPSRRSRVYGLGYVNDEEYYVEALLPRILDSVDLGKNLVAGILDRDSTLRYLQRSVPTSRYLIAEAFLKTYSAWRVVLFHPEGKTVEELVAGEKAIYLTLFVGIVVVMGIGIVLVGRAALHELEAAKMKAEFVSSVSHELKTPLSLIRMFGETLASGLVSDDAKRQEFYHIITSESERLTHLINNVLDFSRMETGNKQYRFEEEDIVQVVRSTLEAYRFHIRDLGFEMTTSIPDDPIMMLLDKDAISQALLNLLNNAVKYSEERKLLRVELTRDAGSVHLSVEDQGVGIPADETRKVFEKFYRTSTAKTKGTTGSGLGLTLVEHIVQAHGGFVDVVSTVGEGSRFTLRLPLRRSAHS